MANKRFCASVARRYATQQPINIEQQCQLADYELTIRNQHKLQNKMGPYDLGGKENLGFRWKFGVAGNLYECRDRNGGENTCKHHNGKTLSSLL